ncbi:MAG TPA: TolC family protein, partial [Thermomonas sp.]|nr:TolC family protein [Thermomonas sp.]
MNHALMRAAALGAALALAGCADPGPLRTPAAPATPFAVGLVDDAPLPAVSARWWQAFGDPTLDVLVERALAGQPGLQLA